MMHAPAKITLKNQTKMTLNARFTALMKNRPIHTSPRSTTMSQRPASEKNRRLAAQMEKRSYSSNTEPKVMPSYKPSVMERLGQRRGGVVPHISVMRGNSRGFVRGVSRGGVHKPYHKGGVFNSGRVGQRGGRGTTRGGPVTRGRGRGRGRGGTVVINKPVSKDELDEALDSYMSSKGGNVSSQD